MARPSKVNQGEKNRVVILIVQVTKQWVNSLLFVLSRKATGKGYFNNLFIFCSPGRQQDSEMTGIITVVFVQN